MCLVYSFVLHTVTTSLRSSYKGFSVINIYHRLSALADTLSYAITHYPKYYILVPDFARVKFLIIIAFRSPLSGATFAKSYCFVEQANDTVSSYATLCLPVQGLSETVFELFNTFHGSVIKHLDHDKPIHE